MKRLVLTFLAGSVATLALLVHAGPEFLVQTGLKLAAFQADYDFVSMPRETAQVSYDTRALLTAQSEPLPAAVRKPGKGRR
jgi:hypothetical protein